ncbi:MAG: hypothetical protein JJU36_06235 [Phycisphaeraceae bacterium]|nr:hypothetical protein [Phycisphaeraceae bacterium]
MCLEAGSEWRIDRGGPGKGDYNALMNSSEESSTTPEAIDGLTLGRFQAMIRDRYYATDKARGTPGTFMWLVEEIGELATALQKKSGQGMNTSGGEDLAGEFADVLAWLCTLANINDVDLEAAVKTKYYTNGGPEGHK